MPRLMLALTVLATLLVAASLWQRPGGGSRPVPTEPVPPAAEVGPPGAEVSPEIPEQRPLPEPLTPAVPLDDRVAHIDQARLQELQRQMWQEVSPGISSDVRSFLDSVIRLWEDCVPAAEYPRWAEPTVRERWELRWRALDQVRTRMTARNAEDREVLTAVRGLLDEIDGALTPPVNPLDPAKLRQLEVDLLAHRDRVFAVRKSQFAGTQDAPAAARTLVDRQKQLGGWLRYHTATTAEWETQQRLWAIHGAAQAEIDAFLK